MSTKIGRLELLYENDSRHGYGNYLKNDILKVTWYQLLSKFSIIARYIDKSIERHLAVENFTDIDQHTY